MLPVVKYNPTRQAYRKAMADTMNKLVWVLHFTLSNSVMYSLEKKSCTFLPVFHLAISGELRSYDSEGNHDTAMATSGK